MVLLSKDKGMPRNP